MIKQKQETISIKPLKISKLKLRVIGKTDYLPEPMDMAVLEKYNKLKSMRIAEKDNLSEEEKAKAKYYFTTDGKKGILARAFYKAMIQVSTNFFPREQGGKRNIREGITIYGDVLPLKYKKEETVTHWGRTSGRTQAPSFCELEMNKIYCMDAIDFMKQISDNSVDMILCDLPYGKTDLEWDKEISIESLWKEYKRTLKSGGVIILTATQPFTSKLILSNLEMFRYELIWEKSRISNPLTNKKEPSRVHENILIFSNKINIYNPQTFFIEEKYIDKRNSINNSNWGKGQFNGVMKRNKDTGERQPQSVIFFKSHWSKDMHPTQKPVALFEYLIKTYTNEQDLVLDCCVGSGTTAIACKNTNRNFICNDNNEEYVKIANQRLNFALDIANEK